MKYRCVDVGNERCPCELMEWGKCYTCSLESGGSCDCGSSGQWLGVCPYSEFLLNNKKRKWEPGARSFTVSRLNRYTEEHVVLHINVSPGFAQKCSRPGAYVMVRSLDYRVPLSVLKSNITGESFIEMAVQTIGPKTKALVKKIKDLCNENSQAAEIEVRGPFYSGLVNTQLVDAWKKENADIVIAARGMAVAPLVNCLDWIYGGIDKATERIMMGRLFLDYGNLPERFLLDYLGEEFIEISRQTHFIEGMEEVCEVAGKSDGFIFLTSPFYTDILQKEHPELLKKTVFANHANMVCGKGICGSCSYVDLDGVTVKKCKCNSTVTMVK